MKKAIIPSFFYCVKLYYKLRTATSQLYKNIDFDTTLAKSGNVQRKPTFTKMVCTATHQLDCNYKFFLN